MFHVWVGIFLILAIPARAQNTIVRLQDAVRTLEADAQLKHAILGFYVVDGKTGLPVYAKNAEIGLVPASCQKVITSVAALDLLGPAYRYKTQLGYDGRVENGQLIGNLHLRGSGDPSLGSWRYASTKEEVILLHMTSQVRKAGIRTVQGKVVTDDGTWGSATVPDGWIWQDIGNYYGAGSSGLNWRENQYDLVLKPGTKIGDTCTIMSTKPRLFGAELRSEVRTAAKGSGDNAFIYLPPYATFGFVRGTIPSGSPFSISGSFPNSAAQLKFTMEDALAASGVKMLNGEIIGSTAGAVPSLTLLHTFVSPPLDSLNHWFLNKSVNLYGEAFIKTIAMEKAGIGSTEKGVDIVNFFWSQRGIEKSAIYIMDGSGLSPQNRVTAAALVNVMTYARSRPWFASFYNALPTINGLKMKSGSIGGARSYTGYVKSATGNEYIFAIIVNNYEGSASEVVKKMFKLLETLK